MPLSLESSKARQNVGGQLEAPGRARQQTTCKSSSGAEGEEENSCQGTRMGRAKGVPAVYQLHSS